MSGDELAARLGYSAALALYLLRDDGYAARIFDYAHPPSLDERLAMIVEIQRRLVAAGILWADEDPYAAGLGVPELQERGNRCPV
jgi:hypothetical protein